MIIQAILFNKEKWDPTSARNWLKKHKYKPLKYVDKSENWLRYRIKEPDLFTEFVTKQYPQHGINIILGKE